jgi:hypothetical protein
MIRSFVVEVTDQRAPEIDLGVAKAGEVGAKRVGSRLLARPHGIGPLDRGVQSAMIALEQLETGRKARRHRRNSGK